MDARIRRQRTLEAVKRIIIRESLKQPLAVILQDSPYPAGEASRRRIGRIRERESTQGLET
jgi:hypothetical protein